MTLSPYVQKAIDDISDLIRLVVEGERERCAKIAEEAYDSHNLADRSPKHIAAAIRGEKL